MQKMYYNGLVLSAVLIDLFKKSEFPDYTKRNYFISLFY